MHAHSAVDIHAGMALHADQQAFALSREKEWNLTRSALQGGTEW